MMSFEYLLNCCNMGSNDAEPSRDVKKIKCLLFGTSFSLNFSIFCQNFIFFNLKRLKYDFVIVWFYYRELILNRL